MAIDHADQKRRPVSCPRPRAHNRDRILVVHDSRPYGPMVCTAVDRTLRLRRLAVRADPTTILY
jgi:hypothetical protein